MTPCFNVFAFAPGITTAVRLVVFRELRFTDLLCLSTGEDVQLLLCLPWMSSKSSNAPSTHDLNVPNLFIRRLRRNNNLGSSRGAPEKCWLFFFGYN